MCTHRPIKDEIEEIGDHSNSVPELAQFLYDLRKQLAQHEKRVERLLIEHLPIKNSVDLVAVSDKSYPKSSNWSKPKHDLPGLPGQPIFDDSGEIGVEPESVANESNTKSSNGVQSKKASVDTVVAWGSPITHPMAQNRMATIKSLRKRDKKSSVKLNLKKVFKKEVSQMRKTKSSDSSSLLSRTLEDSRFETGIICLIIASAACLGVQIEWSMHNLEESTPLFFDIVETLFTVAFTVEISLRISHERMFFFSCANPVFSWNVFDSSIVTLCVLCKLMTLGWVSVPNVSFMRLFRVLRIFRAFRLLRIMRFFSDVRIMVSGIIRSCVSLGWAILLLGFIMYLVAVCLMQVVHDELHQFKTGQRSGKNIDEEILMNFYGSLMRTMYTLYLSISGGIDWGDATQPLEQVSPALVVFFCLYVAFAVFCVLNVVTGVFVDNATKLTQRDEEHVLQEEYDKRLHWFSVVERLFNAVDDGTGQVTLETFQDLINDIEAQVAFSKIGIELDAMNVDNLFRMLDFDNSGAIDIGEFCAGLEMYHGNAKRMDVTRLIHETKKIGRRVNELQERYDPDGFRKDTPFFHPVDTSLYRSASND